MLLSVRARDASISSARSCHATTGLMLCTARLAESKCLDQGESHRSPIPRRGMCDDDGVIDTMCPKELSTHNQRTSSPAANLSVSVMTVQVSSRNLDLRIPIGRCRSG